MPMDERKKLRDIVTKAHGSGRRVRFWATPENEQQLAAIAVDVPAGALPRAIDCSESGTMQLINTDS